MSELSQRIKDVIENEPVALFMKGTPQFVMCGNSDRALRALREAGAPVTAVNVLPDPAIRQELSELSGWPTIPQVFVRGELIGGADITEELAASGELEQKLEQALGPDYRGSRRRARGRRARAGRLARPAPGYVPGFSTMSKTSSTRIRSSVRDTSSTRLIRLATSGDSGP